MCLNPFLVSKLQVRLAPKPSRHQRSDGDCALRLGTPVAPRHGRVGYTVRPHGQSPLPEGWIRYPRYVHVHGQPPDRTVWNRRFRWYLVPRGSPLAIFRRSFFVWFGKPIVFNGLLHLTNSLYFRYQVTGSARGATGKPLIRVDENRSLRTWKSQSTSS